MEPVIMSKQFHDKLFNAADAAVQAFTKHMWDIVKDYDDNSKKERAIVMGLTMVDAAIFRSLPQIWGEPEGTDAAKRIIQRAFRQYLDELIEGGKKNEMVPEDFDANN